MPQVKLGTDVDKFNMAKKSEGKINLVSFPKFGHIWYLIRGKSHGFSVIYTWFKGTSHKVDSQQRQINVDQVQFEEKRKLERI